MRKGERDGEERYFEEIKISVYWSYHLGCIISFVFHLGLDCKQCSIEINCERMDKGACKNSDLVFKKNKKISFDWV